MAGADCAGACCALQAASTADNKTMEMEIEMGFGFMAAAPQQLPRSVPQHGATRSDY